MKLCLWMCKYGVKILFIVITTTVFSLSIYSGSASASRFLSAGKGLFRDAVSTFLH